MKKLNTAVCIVSMLLGFGSVAHAATSYPFIGKKSFNFMGGSGTEEYITITKTGEAIIKMCGDATTGGTCSVEYKGKYTNPIKLKDGTGYLVKGSKIYSLDHGKVSKGCSGDDTSDCVSDLY